MPHELPNDLRLKDLRKLGNFKKIPEMLGLDGEYSVVHLIAKFWGFLVKNCKNATVKHSIEKTILLNFVNFSPTFCARLYQISALTDNFEYLDKKKQKGHSPSKKLKEKKRKTEKKSQLNSTYSNY